MSEQSWHRGDWSSDRGIPAIIWGLIAVFALRKSDDIWTLHYEIGWSRQLFAIGAGIAALGVTIIQSSDRGAIHLAISAVVFFALIGYWVGSEAPTTATFDLKRRRIEVYSRRPWFGRPRTMEFADVLALYAVKRTGETVDAWEANIELRNGTRLRLGSEAAGRSERVRQYLEEIRNVTGIRGR
jgi:hypothetical protein